MSKTIRLQLSRETLQVLDLKAGLDPAAQPRGGIVASARGQCPCDSERYNPGSSCTVAATARCTTRQY